MRLKMEKPKPKGEGLFGGAASVVRSRRPGWLLSSLPPDDPLHEGVDPSIRCEAGQRWQWDGVDFQVLHPAPADYDAASKPNAMSCVLRIANGASTALLAGDIEKAQEARLVAQDAALKSDVLLVPHHGSKTSSSEGFLDAVKPSLALVQAGYRNRFGHPAPPVLERYRERGVAVIDSPHCGAVRWRSGEPSQVSCQRQLAPRYWHHRFP